MPGKITIAILISLLVVVIIQTARLSNAQEEMGAQATALSVSNAKLEAREDLDNTLSTIKASIVANRVHRQEVFAEELEAIAEELSNVKKHECFTNANVVPVEYVRVLNDRSEDKSIE